MALTQSQLADAVGERVGLSRAQAKGAIQALEEVVLDQIGNAEKVKIGNLVQLTVRLKPATKISTATTVAFGSGFSIGGSVIDWPFGPDATASFACRSVSRYAWRTWLVIGTTTWLLLGQSKTCR